LPLNGLGGVGLDLVPAATTPTINRSSAFAALPSVIGGPASDFFPAQTEWAGSANADFHAAERCKPTRR
jgi:hypothetical protein